MNISQRSNNGRLKSFIETESGLYRLGIPRLFHRNRMAGPVLAMNDLVSVRKPGKRRIEIDE